LTDADNLRNVSYDPTPEGQEPTRALHPDYGVAPPPAGGGGPTNPPHSPWAAGPAPAPRHWAPTPGEPTEQGHWLPATPTQRLQPGQPGPPQPPQHQMQQAPHQMHQQHPQHQMPQHPMPQHPMPQHPMPPPQHQPQGPQPQMPDYPVSASPVSASPGSYPPISAPPTPVGPASGPPMPVGNASAPPAGSPPWSSQPASGWTNPEPRQPAWTNGDPLLGAPAEGSPGWRPRIEPTPRPPRRGRLVIFAVIGLLAGLLIAAPVGFIVGSRNADDSTEPKSANSAAPSASASLGPFEASQLALNKTKFDGELATFAEPWLPWIGGCSTNTEANGPKLNAGEKTRIFCRYGGPSVIFFVLYNSVAERDKARLSRERQNLDADQLAPGVKPSASRGGASGTPSAAPGGAAGVTYVEYAFRNSAGRTIAGIWWGRNDSPASAYLEVPWEEGLGAKWEPIRDIWQRRN
jgi:hypothetical protein